MSDGAPRALAWGGIGTGKEVDAPVVSVWIENVWRYLLLTRFTDILDVALMAFLLYKLLTLLKTTSGTNLLKGVLIFLAVLFLSSILHLNGISFILSRMLEWGVLALIILFQPEIRRVLEQVGSQRLKFLNLFSREGTVSDDGAHHRSDGAGLHGDVPQPHRRPHRL